MIKLKWRISRKDPLSGFFIREGERFNVAAYCEQHGLAEDQLCERSLMNVRAEAAKLESGEWLSVSHEAAD